ncbi:methyltransferase domain-containing protein [Methanosarcina sp. Z-7115]|uniref:Methyltransferase domain-containing protein n=1 Tax=Methanosarcina baikalica TaxID=3073890 RepID=A0ABU2D009_9EURY|nr:methyltransferase domain-containing protein [Methanosarcina sp. Z-7115]MDR7665276.1 methyltransferase domain-containing protein [Methanosarcina sp. Z-7115]
MGIAPKKSKFSWNEYFSDKKDGGHRHSTEEFLNKEAKEKLLHLDGGTSLLDFGCGAGELLIYYAPCYEMVVGVDFSPSMLDEARRKVAVNKYDNVCLIKADDKTVWNEVSSLFDRITTTEVLQYLTFEQIDSFIETASKYLNNDGKIVFFDIIEPRSYVLWKIGFFSKRIHYLKVLPTIFVELFDYICASLSNSPKDIIGYSHNPYKIEKIANKYGFEMEYIRSIYYEYRYHAILSRKLPL